MPVERHIRVTWVDGTSLVASVVAETESYRPVVLLAVEEASYDGGASVEQAGIRTVVVAVEARQAFHVACAGARQEGRQSKTLATTLERLTGGVRVRQVATDSHLGQHTHARFLLDYRLIQ